MSGELYGKMFATTYEGSMRGMGANVHAVWPWVISHAIDGHVEMNPRRVADEIGMTVEEVQHVIERLCAEDPDSRNPDYEGKRLLHLGAFLYRVVSHLIYRKIAKSNALREYNRERQADRRAKLPRKQKRVKQRQTASNNLSLTSAPNASASAYAETEALEPPLVPPQPKENPRATKKGATPPKGPAAPKASATRGRSPKTVDAWAGPSREHSAYASRHGLDLDTEVASFRDHHLAEGTVLPKGWPAAFAKWLLDRTPPAEPKPEPEPKPKRPRRSVSPPAGWAPSDEHRQIAREGGVDFEREFQKCLDHQLARNEGFVGQRGWDAGVRNWMRRAPEFNRSRYSKPSEPSPTESRVLPAEEAARLRAAAAQPSIRKAKQASQESA